MFNNNLTITENEWKNVKNIHQKVLDDNKKLFDKNLQLEEELDSLAKETSSLAIRNIELEKELSCLQYKSTTEEASMRTILETLNSSLELLETHGIMRNTKKLTLDDLYV